MDAYVCKELFIALWHFFHEEGWMVSNVPTRITRTLLEQSWLAQWQSLLPGPKDSEHCRVGTHSRVANGTYDPAFKDSECPIYEHTFWNAQAIPVCFCGFRLSLFVASQGILGRFALLDPKNCWNMFLVTSFQGLKICDNDKKSTLTRRMWEHTFQSRQRMLQGLGNVWLATHNLPLTMQKQTVFD